MTAVRPRALVHRGCVAASGILLERSLLGEGGMRLRALAVWEPDARVLEVEGGLVIRFSRPRPLDAGLAPGHLLLEAGEILLAAPLSAAELAALSAPPGSIATVRAGCAIALVPRAEVDPSAWLGLEPALVAVEPLGAPAQPPAPPPPQPALDVRRALAIAPAAAESARAAAALRATAARATKSEERETRAGAVSRRLLGWLREEVSLLVSAFRRPAWSGAGRAPVLAVPPRSRPIARALRRLVTRLALVTRIARLIGIRQGAYIGRLLRMFERGDLDEALRHAIPLRGPGGLDDLLALGMPRPRESLAISAHPPASGGSIGLGPELYGEMQRLYRRGFEMLEARGRIDEAAFVLAELLRADLEAVSFLERHGRLRLAAELAEARSLPAGLAVRQWFLAGDVERAVQLARARHAFADAVERLERSGRRGPAEALRLCWAEDLATAGDLEAAVQVVWPIERARPLAARWIELAVGAGGAAGLALLPTWLTVAPDRFPEVRARVLAACADETEDGPFHRAALVRGFARARASDAIHVLARPLLRSILRDRSAGLAESTGFGRLADLAADGALEVDLPAAPPATGPSREVVSVAFREDEGGARPVLDAAVLPNGRVLAALGEAGVALLTRDGRAVARFDVPAHRLVVSDLGTRALALAPRGEAMMVSRLDLEARTALPVRDLRIRTFAHSYDGAAWVVGTEDSVLLLDCLRDDLRTLWHVPALPGVPLALTLEAKALSFVTFAQDGSAEGWIYDLPSFTLRRRESLSGARDGEMLLGLGGLVAGRWFAVVRPEAEDGAPLLRPALGGPDGAHALPGAEALLGLVGGDVVAAALRTSSGVEVVALGAADLRPRALVSLAGARRASVRTAGLVVTVADDRGRIVGVDLNARRVSHELRV